MTVADRTVEGPAPAGRVDLAVASVAGISRAHAQRLIGDGRALVDGSRRRSSDRLAGGERVSVVLSAPPDQTLLAESIPLVVAYEDDDMLIVDKPAGLVVHPSAGHGTRHARERPAGSCARSRRAARLDRRRRPAGDRPSARQGDQRPDRRRQDRCGAGQPDAPVRRPERREGVPRARARRGAGLAWPRRGADRPRSAGSPADGGRGRRPRIGHRLRAARRRWRVRAAGAPPENGAHAPDPRASGVSRPADRGRHALRRRGGSGRPSAPVPARGPARARAPLGRGAADAPGAACRRTSPTCLATAGVEVAAGTVARWRRARRCIS